ncbi:tetratricopeptide repeat protein [Streptomonospora salina]|uniref:Tetratricopeptide (TPR) repeat protein n=1 Tax=Streptomonospora salina TaxID=104205 RepID=A0A841E568_9ACTN|nr:tetratricopeptide repeat protein [Streptomonospora salina]MBB5996429.1 tetratricopeptide (TPR) repeat protein [Streptomonospora salina]
MTASAGSSAHASGDEPELASLLEQARDLAENGHLDRAAQVYERVVEGGSPRYLPRAALGLAVVRHDMGDVAAAHAAARTAIATGHPEFAPRAAYHLALSLESAGEDDRAREAWNEVMDSGNNRYRPAAHYGLARLAEERGDTRAAEEHWEQVLQSGSAEVAPEAAHDYAARLLAQGRPDAAADVVDRGLEAGEHAGLRLLLGAVHVEYAISAFGAVVGEAEAEAGTEADAATAVSGPAVAPEVAGGAVELLARLLAVRGDGETAERVWADGLAHRDPATAGEVRARLRRGFLAPEPGPASDDRAPEQDEGADWWEPYVEAAAAQNSAPMLTGELFVALDRMYTRLALPLAQGEGDPEALRRAVQEAVRTPGQYVWGPALDDDFRERLRVAAGSRAPVLPEGWPGTAD